MSLFGVLICVGLLIAATLLTSCVIIARNENYSNSFENRKKFESPKAKSDKKEEIMQSEKTSDLKNLSTNDCETNIAEKVARKDATKGASNQEEDDMNLLLK